MVEVSRGQPELYNYSCCDGMLSSHRACMHGCWVWNAGSDVFVLLLGDTTW